VELLFLTYPTQLHVGRILLHVQMVVVTKKHKQREESFVDTIVSDETTVPE
jgi:hypothetical protein